MPSCAIITCRARSQDVNVTNGRISFHRFPKEPTIKEQWIEVTGRKDWMPTKTSTICSKHFKEKDYDIKKSGHKYLKCGAVPQEKVVRIYSTGIESPIAAKAKKHKFQSISDESELIKRRKVESTSLTSDINSTTSTPKSHSNYSEQEMKYAEENLPCSNTSTPRKRKLKEIIITKDNVIKRQRKQIKKIQAQNRRLKKKVNKIEDIMNDLQKRFFLRNEELETLKNTNIQVEDLIARYISKSKSGTDNKQKYSPAIRSFALTLHYYSPKAYEYVRNTFDTCLPHTRTLRKWYSSVEGEPGFTSESFAALKLKVETTKYPIIAGLVMDEMAIRRRIEWDGSKLHGFVEIGNKQCSDHITEAKEALVFLVTGINCNFKVPVAYFLVDGVTGDQRSDLVKQCLERIHDTGVKIVSLTFDGCASNLAMIKKFGCSFDNGGNMTFEHPVTKHLVMAVLDPSHMIKLIRNAFQVYQTFLDVKGKKIQWAYLEELNKVQEKEKFHLRNKLRHRHIHFQNQKMKVKLATQLFSLNVADAIDFCEKKLNMSEFQDSSATTFFLIVINNMFDIFNSRSLNQYGYKKAINEWNAPTIFAYLDEAVQYISTLKTQDGTLLINSPRKVGFLGFLGCAQAIKHFYTTLIQTKELLFFPFYKVSQDHLELLFCNIRCHGGANNNPTARQFKAAYKKLLVHVEIKDFGNGNCTALENLSILHCSSAIKRINLTTPSNREFEEDQEDDGSEEKKFAEFYQNMSDFSIQVLSHIAGNVVHVLMEKIQCDICVGALVSNLRNSQHKFIVSKDRGGLLYPSDDVITICKKAESVIRHYTDNSKKFTKEFLVTKILHSFVGTTLFDDIAFHQIGEYPTSNHVTDLMKAVIKKYINIRVHFLLKEYVSKETKRQLLTKYVLFQGQ